LLFRDENDHGLKSVDLVRGPPNQCERYSYRVRSMAKVKSLRGMKREMQGMGTSRRPRMV
jgi:hypothetical protein